MTRDYDTRPSQPTRTRTPEPRQAARQPVPIMGEGDVNQARLAGFLKKANPSLDRQECRNIAQIYIEEARAEGVNSDVAFCQMCLETNFLKYGGAVEADQRNFSGLGATGGGAGGATFYTVRSGIRAHIQHLKAYASKESLNHQRLDPRFHLVRRGSAPYVRDLTGTWATDPQYGDKILSLLKRLRSSGSPK